MQITILLADDHEIFRSGLRSLIEKEHGLKVIGEAENGQMAIHLARELKPDVVVMDIGMPDMNGIEATRQITASVSGVKVLALSMHTDKRFVKGMLKAGASGYMLKDGAFEELIHAIRLVTSNRIYLSPGISSVLLDAVRHPFQDGGPALPLLTAKEREVLQLVAEGKSTKEIASQLDVSVKTTETHRQHIMEKLDIHNVADLTKYAVREGLTSVEP
ncbi:MAG: response regulator transcription factor [Candidatus Sumerlaeota bacterium]|nr:response regulator transcription factor [Candidatus Sumerlaeota bacterium]